MSKRTFGASLLTALCAFSSAVRADEPMRCGSSLITSQDSVETLLAKCGEPAKKESRVEEVYNNMVNGRRAKVGTKTIETWIYQRSRGAIPRAVIIIDGDIKSIETQL